jgi:hypothetical protein
MSASLNIAITHSGNVTNGNNIVFVLSNTNLMNFGLNTLYLSIEGTTTVVNLIHWFYSNNIPNKGHRAALAGLRISNHKLKIETGRYKNPIIPREDNFEPFKK